MPEWASELRLRGACLAGKPGLIVIEGDSQRVREFVRKMTAQNAFRRSRRSPSTA
ncbi:uncharacterized protein ACA1_194290 [Acanthamoeba castellanii str. Neff]|uniref:Small nuclear ribonucleoprotein Prp3 C-terminal domain-containing protein n=1 Tax=Acanthamoeba castellanii (strain ATCC 30010 / Neff) TaxID=1257118 RepID=L8GR04_ACACF|nr:uncharacterized protein ACA1_194290 [Acanthamoeba castellanii str. Neff]ELR15362.1 hypothetical protein ACA1_194290 [Acanthamoeba castellanii str. Neff]